MPCPAELMCGYQTLSSDSLCHTQHLYVRDVILPPKTKNRDFKQLATTPPKWSTGSKDALSASTAKSND